ncbi:MAG: hypothetical protein ACYC67_26275 [Prosthecobacter sp.]
MTFIQLDYDTWFEQFKPITKTGTDLMRGDIAALDEVKALPGDDAVAGLLMFFKQNFYVYSKETQKKAIAAKAAQYITECPTAADYIKRLFKKEEGRPKSGLLMNYRQTTLDSLTSANNKFAVSLLIELMDESNLEVPPGDFGVAIAKMGIPSAPFAKTELKSASTPDGVATWKSWWKENKGGFPDK